MSDQPNPENTPEPTTPPERTPTGGIPPVSTDERGAPLPPRTDAGPAGRAAPAGQRRGGCGCWIPVIVAGFIALLLVIAGLFLPPVNLYDRLFGVQYVQLNPAQNGIGVDGFAFIVDPDQLDGEFGVALDAVPLEDFINPPADAPEWVRPAAASVPQTLALQSAVFDIQTNGQTPDVVNLTLDIPASVANADLIDVYGYDTSTARWRFLPSQPTTDGKLTVEVDETIGALPARVALFQASAVEPAIHTIVDIQQVLNDNAGRVASIVSPAGLTPNLDGSLVGSLAPGFNFTSGYRVMPVIRNFTDARAIDTQTVPAILNNRAARQAHVQQITAVAANGGYAGVFVDYRELPEDSRDLFALFITELGRSFDSAGLSLGVIVPAAQNVEGTWQTGAYDWQVIGQAADYVSIDLTPNPTTFAPGEDRLVEAMLRWATGEVERVKILAGLEGLSVREVNGDFSTVTYQDALSGLGNVTIDAEASENGVVAPGEVITARLDGSEAVQGLDTETASPFIDYFRDDGTLASRVWLTTPAAMRFRLEQLRRFAIGGATIANLAADGLASDLLAAIFDYRLQVPSQPEQTALALRWRIEDANGLLDEVVTGLNEPLVVTLEAVEGNFAINVEIIDGERSASVRSGAAVPVFAPTSTPTPLPTMTPTPQPSITPTLEVLVPTTTNVFAQGSSSPAINPGSGSIMAGFEYGGHVTSSASDRATRAMQDAGMTWMKVQDRYRPGKNPGDVAAVINEARARGFKILIGTVGEPSELAAGGSAYIQEFANYLGGVAALGPDAIEVWNEPNIDREWPTGQISGANYTSMLSAAYQQIKSRNPNVMVISAAPAPTGAEALFTSARVVNDDRFLAQMVSAGAMSSLDCVGVHYNEGIVGPSQVSGDPRQDYYTRYFPRLTDTYWNITGGQKPLCYTELGYLTSEGYPGLGSNWQWASGVTVAQQAAWLAEAISIASQSGRIRLLIVWNIDFQAYDANDPQGGYAIVRPGDGCPACQAIAGAR